MFYILIKIKLELRQRECFVIVNARQVKACYIHKYVFIQIFTYLCQACQVKLGVLMLPSYILRSYISEFDFLIIIKIISHVPPLRSYFICGSAEFNFLLVSLVTLGSFLHSLYIIYCSALPPPTSNFKFFPFYPTTHSTSQLSAFCFQSIPSAALLSLSLSLFHSLFPSSSVNCSLNSVKVRLQLNLPQLHMSVLLSVLLYSEWSCLTSLGRERGSRVGELQPEVGLACLPGTQLWRTEPSLPLCLSFSTHLVHGGIGPCYSALFCPWLSRVAGFWPRYAAVGSDLRCGYAQCCTHMNEAGS